VSQPYRIFGAELSPYSVKVRSYFRYKGLRYHWIIRSAAVQEDYNKYAKLPIIPLVVTPQDQGIQDSTPIIEHLESLYPEPSIHPADPAAPHPRKSLPPLNIVNRVGSDDVFAPQTQAFAERLETLSPEGLIIQAAPCGCSCR